MSMSMVSAGSALPRYERLYAAASAPEATNRTEKSNRIERRDDDGDDDSRRARRSEDGPGRRNPLVNALMQALQGLMAPSKAAPGTAAATAPAPTAAAAPASGSTNTTPTPAKENGDSLKDAAIAFASELFSALRSVRSDEGRGRGGDYRDMAQGLRTLARKIEVPSAGAPTLPSPVPASPSLPASSQPATPGLPVVATPAPPPAAAAPAPKPVPDPVSTATPVAPLTAAPAPGLSIEININVQIRYTSAATATSAPPAASAPKEESPLLTAFKRLMDRLKPMPEAGSATEAGAARSSPEEKLKAFLLTIADALSQGRDRRGEAGTGTLAPVGGLLSIAA